MPWPCVLTWSFVPNLSSSSFKPASIHPIFAPASRLSIVINGFTFRVIHGSEICNKCGISDYGKTNNARIRHPKLLKLKEELDVGKNCLDLQPNSCPLHSRPSLVGAFEEVMKRDEGPPYQCKSHKTVGYATCFDWDQKLMVRIKLYKSRDNITIDSSRDEN